MIISACLALTLALVQTAEPDRFCYAKPRHSSAQDQILELPRGDAINEGLISMADNLKGWFGVDADLYYTPRINNAFADGSSNIVVIGEGVLREAQSNSPGAVIVAMSFVMAHEYAHHFEFRMWDEIEDLDLNGMSVPVVELQADVLAGYIAGRESKGQVTEPRRNPLGLSEADFLRRNWQAYSAHAGTLGDFLFSDKNHHGTPQQRSKALTVGWQAGTKKASELEEDGEIGEKMYKWSYDEARKIFGLRPDQDAQRNVLRLDGCEHRREGSALQHGGIDSGDSLG